MNVEAEITAEVATAYVYLIRHPETGAHKIGYSADPKSRIGQLAPASAGLSLVATIPTNEPLWLEGVMHQAFAHRRASGEWFLLSDDEIALFMSVPHANCEADIPPTITALWEFNRGRGFVSDCAGACAPPSGRHLLPRKSFHMPADLHAALDDYCRETRPRPTKSEVLRVALEEFLQSKNLWPPPADPSK